jgi:hypothetical protein
MCGGLFKEWMAHLCGLCLALRDEHGHVSRLVTNYDGLLVSVLTEAQALASSPHRRAAACALRGFKGADVVEADGSGTAAALRFDPAPLLVAVQEQARLEPPAGAEPAPAHRPHRGRGRRRFRAYRSTGREAA